MNSANVIEFRKTTLVYSISIELIKDRVAEPLPGMTNPIGELSAADLPEKDRRVMAACLREAADMIDPGNNFATGFEGISITKAGAYGLLDQVFDNLEITDTPWIDAATPDDDVAMAYVVDMVAGRSPELAKLSREALKVVVTAYMFDGRNP
jgi:hypothetical protein